MSEKDDSQRKAQEARHEDTVVLARRCLRWALRRNGAPAGQDQVGPEPAHVTDLEAVRELTNLSRAVDDELTDAVHRSRDSGATWNEIGRALGVTRQAAHAHFGR